MAGLSKRDFLAVGAGSALLAACRSTGSISSVKVAGSSPAVERRAASRRKPGASTVSGPVTAAPVSVALGGRTVSTWAFGDRPGQGGLRAKAGDLLDVTFTNGLTSANTVHWHGIALRNDMDGVHDLTQPAVAPAVCSAIGLPSRIPAPTGSIRTWVSSWIGACNAGAARKDTVIVLPMSSVEVDVQADNPGQWMLHCHNTYHLETGMATVLSYRA